LKKSKQFFTCAYWNASCESPFSRQRTRRADCLNDRVQQTRSLLREANNRRKQRRTVDKQTNQRVYAPSQPKSPSALSLVQAKVIGRKVASSECLIYALCGELAAFEGEVNPFAANRLIHPRSVAHEKNCLGV